MLVSQIEICASAPVITMSLLHHIFKETAPTAHTVAVINQYPLGSTRKSTFCAIVSHLNVKYAGGDSCVAAAFAELRRKSIAAQTCPQLILNHLESLKVIMSCFIQMPTG